MKLFKFTLASLLAFTSPSFGWDQTKSTVIKADAVSGVSSTPNYWKSGDAELADAAPMKVTTYNDGASEKPVDCTGGSPAITVARSATAPMYDKQSWLITKPVGDLRGQGVAFEFDVDNGIAAVEMMDLMFEYIVGSGTFAAGSDTTNSDLMVYVYDVTAGQLIEPKGGSKLYTSSTTLKGDYRGWFQSTLGSKKYRVCLHQATTSASAYTLKVDAGKVQKSKYVVGTIITDWESYTPTIAGLGAGSTSANLARYRRVGDQIEIVGRFVKDGTNGTGSTNLSIPIPTGLSIDNGKTTNSNEDLFGTVLRFTVASGWVTTSLVRASGSSVRFVKPGDMSGQGWTGTDAPANSIFTYNFSVPIQGWSAGARMSDGYDGSPLYLKVQANNTTSPLTLTTTLQAIPFPTVSRDPLGCFNTTTGVCTVPRSSFYCAAGNAVFAITGTMPAAGAEIARLELTIGNSGHIDQWFSTGASTTGGNQKLAVTACQYLSAGQTISLKARKDASVSAATGTISQFADGNNLSIWDALQGYSIMSPTALWETHYAGTAGDTIGTSDSLIKFTTKVEDTFGSYNPSTGLWTAKGPATCSTDARIQGVSVNMSTTQSFGSALRKDGAAINNGTIMYGAGVSRVPSSIISASSIKVVQGTTLSVYAYSDVATTASTSQTSNYFTVSCRQ